jgi:toxin ParE1/3/4
VRFEVVISDDADRDIEGIYRYIAAYDSVGSAGDVVGALEKTCSSLAMSPGRGNYPKELIKFGIQEYRELHFKPYRIVYRIVGRKVIVHGVFDGRRDMQTLLRQRLLR